VRAEARDGYRVAFSLVELDSTIASSEVFIAFQRDGKPLPAEMGPFRLIVPTDKRGARWIRQLSRITLIEAGPTNWAATRTADRPDFR
jgi:DMSO/TMAO reductase YedYZ molybdopterin-dependent catalytic subunit